MSLLLFKDTHQNYPDKKFFEDMWPKVVSGGAYALLQTPENSYVTYECCFKTKYEAFVEDVMELKNSAFSGKLVILFISTACSSDMEKTYTLTTTNEDNWQTILGEGAFKGYATSQGAYLPIRKFVNFCKNAFSGRFIIGAKGIASVLENVNKIHNSNDSYLIIGSKTDTIYHNLVLDEELNLYVSNDSYLTDLNFEEKNYFLYGLLNEAIRNNKLGDKTPKMFFEQLKQLSGVELRKKIKELIQQKILPSFT